MVEVQDRLERANAAVVVVSFEDKGRAESLRARLDLPFRLALDPARAAYRAFGLERASVRRAYFHPAVASFYAKALAHRRLPDLRRGQDRTQLGGDFVLDREGFLVLAHPERGPEDRAPIETILRAIEGIDRSQA